MLKRNYSGGPYSVFVIAIASLSGVLGCMSSQDRGNAFIMADSSQAADRIRAIGTLGQLQDEEALSALRRLAADDDPDVKGYAIETLGAVYDRESGNLLIAALGDKRSWTRCRKVGLRYQLSRELICFTANDSLQRVFRHTIEVDWEKEGAEENAKSRWRAFLDHHE